jgi:hypothetical protein
MSTPVRLEIPNDIASTVQLSKNKFKKMIFITNALDQGWTIKKSQDSYIFTKKHENRREIFQENYLEEFLISNFSKDILDFSMDDN